jgi:hypothetical protein
MGIGVLSWGYGDWGVKLTTHLHLVLWLRMSGAIPLLPSWREQGQLDYPVATCSVFLIMSHCWSTELCRVLGYYDAKFLDKFA